MGLSMLIAPTRGPCATRRLKPEDQRAFYTTEHRRQKQGTAFYLGAKGKKADKVKAKGTKK